MGEFHEEVGGSAPAWVPPPTGVMLVTIGGDTAPSILSNDSYAQVASIDDLPRLIHRAVARS